MRKAVCRLHFESQREVNKWNENRLARRLLITVWKNDAVRVKSGTAGNGSVRYQGGMLITPDGIPTRSRQSRTLSLLMQTA